MGKINVIFIVGAPGSGKGTACSRFAEENEGYTHISTGDLIRKYAMTPRISNLLAAGKLIPSKVTCSLLKKEMKSHKKGNTFIIDGFPRNEENLRVWNSTMKEQTELVNVVLFDCTEEKCLSRCLERGLTSGRSDDVNVEVIKKRIETYKTTTFPIIENFVELWGDVIKYCGSPVKYLDSSAEKEVVYQNFSRIIKND